MFKKELSSWCISERHNFLSQLEQWRTASKEEISYFTKAIAKLGSQQPSDWYVGYARHWLHRGLSLHAVSSSSGVVVDVAGL